MVQRHLDPLFSPVELIERAIPGLELGGMHPNTSMQMPLRHKSAAFAVTDKVDLEPAGDAVLTAGTDEPIGHEYDARSANGTSLDRPSDSSRIFQRPSWSNKVRTARTGPQVEVSRTSDSGSSAVSRASSAASRRWNFGSIWTKTSLRPRSVTTRCLTLPFSRKASTTQTYLLMVPLLERILTVRGYMVASITTKSRNSADKMRNFKINWFQIVTTLFRLAAGCAVGK